MAGLFQFLKRYCVFQEQFNRRNHVSRQTGNTRLRSFEQLEDRRVLANFFVTNLDDAPVNTPESVGTLRQAIFDANADAIADTITFDWNAIGVDRDLQLSSLGEIQIDAPVTIDAGLNRPDDNKLTIHAYDPNINVTGNGERIFYIDSLSGNFLSTNSKVELNDLRFTGGDAGSFTGGSGEGSGGAIHAAFNNTSPFDPHEPGGILTLSINNSRFENNFSANGGGAVDFQAQGLLTIDNSEFSGNRTGLNGGGAVAVLSSGGGDIEVIVSDTTFRDNRSGDSDGGGALYVFAREEPFGSPGPVVSFDVVRSHFENNWSFAEDNADPDNFQDGGAISYVYESDIGTSVFEISQSTFENNVAGLRGGAIYVNDPGDEAEMLLDEVLIANNRTYLEGGIGSISVDGGGGIFSNIQSIVIRDSMIIDNTSNGVGGGIAASVGSEIISISGSTIAGNQARGYGGGLFAIPEFGTDVSPKQITVRNATLSGNQVVAMPDGTSRGGGIWLSTGKESVAGDLDVELANVTVYDNTAVQGAGIFGLQTTGPGGVDDGISPLDLELFNSIVAGNNGLNDIDAIFQTPTNPDEFDDDTFIESTSAHNLLGVLDGNLSGQVSNGVDGNKLNVTEADLGLLPLAYNGGPTFTDEFGMLTHALVETSIAIDAGNDAYTSSATDQRGGSFARGVNNLPVIGDLVGDIDIGAYEVQGQPVTPGDYNRDGSVNLADYTIWRDMLGSEGINPYDGADGNGDGDVNQIDYLIWKANFGGDPAMLPSLPGDYNEDGVVNIADYTVWSDSKGTVVPVFTDADGSGNSYISSTDYRVWKANFGATASTAATGAAVVPGDYNADQTVDDSDFYIWQESLGSTVNLEADGNGNGVVDLSDLAVWQENYMVTTLDVMLGDFDNNRVVDMADMALWESGDSRADADADGDVDQADYDIWQANFGLTDAEVAPYLTSPVTGLPFEVPMMAPQVTGVTLGGAGSSHSVFDVGAVTGSGEQIRTVPVGGLDTINITFSEEVYVTENALALSDIAGSTLPAVSSFGYDIASRTAAWTFASPLDAGQYTIDLDDSIIDLDHEKLDGEFYSPWALSEGIGDSAALPSGDGKAGGNFEFRFTSLPGDFNHDNVVDSADQTIYNANVGVITTGATHADGDANGDGAVTTADGTILTSNLTLDYTEWDIPNVILVSNVVDDGDANLSLGDLSLREAVAIAEYYGGHHTIVFHYNLLNQSIDLTLGEIDINEDVSINGPGTDKLTISGSDSSRIFEVKPNNDVEIRGLTIADGRTTGTEGGGGVHNRGDLLLENVVLEDNYTDARGGAVYTAKGQFEIRNSTVRNNTAKSGGGLGGMVYNGATFTMVGTTVVDNTADQNGDGSGGGAFLWGSSTNPGAIKIFNSTFGGNTAAEHGGGIRGYYDNLIQLVNVTVTDNYAGETGGGVSFGGGSIILTHNSIISGNDAYNTQTLDGDAVFDVASSYNLLGVINGGNSGLTNGVAGNIIGVTDPGLTALTDNGGDTLTYALLDGSQAIDAGDNAIAAAHGLLFDQRGEWRVTDGDGDSTATVDIGAFELGADEYFGALGA